MSATAIEIVYFLWVGVFTYLAAVLLIGQGRRALCVALCLDAAIVLAVNAP